MTVIGAKITPALAHSHRRDRHFSVDAMVRLKAIIACQPGHDGLLTS